MVDMKRIISFTLSLVLLFSMLPVPALAEEIEQESSSAEANTEIVGDTENVETAESEIAVVDVTDLTETILNGHIAITYGAHLGADISDTSVYFDLDNDGSGSVREEILTISNQTDAYNYTFSFDPGDGTSLTLNNVPASGTTYMLGPGQQVEIIVTVEAGEVGDLEFSDFTPMKVETANVTFVYDNTLGSITVGGNTVASGETVTISAEGAEVVAAANDGVSFLGWMDATLDENGILNGTRISPNASTHISPSGDCVVKAAFTHADADAWFRAGSDCYSNDLSAALGRASQGTGTEAIVVLLADGTLKQDCTIPAGVTLLIPYNNEHTLCTTKPSTTSASWVLPTAFRTLKLDSGVDIMVEGALSVSGTAMDTTFQGNVYGPYGHIRMNSGSTISVGANANLYTWGYISGSGTVTVQPSGTVYENFQTMGWRGGTISREIAEKKDTYKLFPLSQFYVQNVEVPMTFLPGAQEKAYLSVDSDFGTGEALINLVGSDNGLLRVKSGSLVKDYNETTDYMEFTVKGTVELQNLVIDVTAMGQTESMDSSGFNLPLPSHFKITVKSSGALNVQNDVAMHPGSELIIEEGATVNVAAGKSVLIYDLDEWSVKEKVTIGTGVYTREYNVGDGYIFIGSGNRHIRPVMYTTRWLNDSPRGTDATKLKDAKICVDGLLNASEAYLYTTVGGADICSNGGGEIRLKKISGSMIEYQALQGGSNNKTVNYIAIDNEPAKLKNADGTYVATVDAALTTLYFDAGVWGTTQAPVVAKVDWKSGAEDTEYKSVQSAVNAATNAGDRVVLTGNATLGAPVEVPSSHNIVLDLNGFEIHNETGSAVTNYGTLLITDSSENGGGTLSSSQYVASSDSVYGYAATVRNHGTLSVTNVTIQAHTAGYRVGLLNRAGGTVSLLDQVSITASGSSGHGIYNFGTVKNVGNLDIQAANCYVARDTTSSTEVFGTAGSTVSLNASNIAIWVRNGAKITTIGADGSTIYIDKGRTVNADGTVTQTAGHTGIYVSSGAEITTVGGAGSTMYLSASNAIYAAGSGEDGVGTITFIADAGSNLNFTGCGTAIFAENGGIVGTVGNGGAVTITSTQNGIYASNGGKINTVGNAGSTITVDVTNVGFYTKGAGYASHIGTIGNGGSILVTAGAIGICVNNNGNSVGTIGTAGTVVVVAGSNNAIHMGSGSTIEEIGKGLTAITLADGRYALWISGANTASNIAAASVDLISGGYYYTPKESRDYAVYVYANRTYPKGYSLMTEPVSITVNGSSYNALAVGHEHSYGEPVFVWANDYGSATASITCPDCDETSEGHSYSGPCQITSSETRGHLAAVKLGDELYTDFVSKIGDGFGPVTTQLAPEKKLASAPYTVEAWIKIEKGLSTRPGIIWGNYNGSGAYISFEVYTNGYPKLQWSPNNSTTGKVEFKNVDLRTGEWTHVAITIDGGNGYCYLNGALAQTLKISGSVDINTCLSTTYAMTLGADPRKSGIPYFNGKIASVAAYSDVRTAEEVLADVMAPDGNDQNLLVHYEVSSTTGSYIPNLSGNKAYDIGKCSHEYDVTFAWADDRSTATATATCSKCSDSTTVDCTVQSMNGRYEATAIIEEESYKDYKFELTEGVTIASNEMRIVDQTLGAVPLTYEAWIKMPTNAGRMVILGSFPNESSQSYINFEIYENGNPRLCWHTGSATGGAIFDDVDVRTDEWVHLAVTRDGNTVQCYVNGKAKGTAKTVTTAMPNLPTNTLAKHLVLGNDYRGTMNFTGEIASVALYTNVRTEAEIAADMFSPVKEDLLIHYELNSAAANTNITDLSGNGYHISHEHEYTVSFSWAENYASATATAVCSACSEDVEGHTQTVDCTISTLEGRGYKAKATIAGEEHTDTKYVMDGMTFGEDFIYESSKLLGTAPVTYEAWVKIPTGTADKASTVIGSYSGGKGKFIDLEITKDGYPRLCWSDKDTSSGSTGSIVFTKGSVFTGEWVHIAVVYDADSNSATYYQNGVFVETVALPSTNTSKLPNAITNKKAMALGGDFRSNNANRFPGQIASVALYADARTLAEIQADMITPGTEGLILHYEVNSNSVTGTIQDLSGNGYDIVNPWVNVEELADYAYSFMVVGDTQKAARQYPNDFHKIYDYVLNNVTSKKVKFVFGLGDIVDYNIINEANETPQWDLAAAQIKRMDNVVPYSVIRGNHDQVESFNKYFPVSAYENRIGGYLNDMRNTWQTFEVGNIKYLVVNLDFGPTKDMIDWANEVIEQHPNYNVIVTTHSYLQKDGTTLDGAENASPTRCYNEWGSTEEHYDGDDMWNALVSKHDNIVLLLCGHDPSAEIVTVQTKGEKGNTVTQMLVDPQDLDRDMAGGVGMVATLYISEDGKNVTVDYYSTFHEKYYLAENQFTTTMDVHAWDDGVTTPATCTEAGSIVYTCRSCKTEHQKTVALAALDHKWGETTYNFEEDGKTCSASRVCKNDETHTETAEAEITSAVKTPVTCEGKGTTTYTATFTEDWAEIQTKDVEDIPALEHTPGEAVEENRVEATATADGSYDRVVYCSVCGTELSRETVTIPKLEAPAGTTVSGTVKAYNGNKAPVVKLYADGEAKYADVREAMASGNQYTWAFNFNDVEAGTYDLEIVKAGHLTYTVTGVQVTGETLDLNTHSNSAVRTMSMLCGDIDGNGWINSTDLGIILQGQNYGKETTANGANALADLDGNGWINSTDLGIVLQAQHYGKGTVTIAYAQ